VVPAGEKGFDVRPDAGERIGQDQAAVVEASRRDTVELGREVAPAPGEVTGKLDLVGGHERDREIVGGLERGMEARAAIDR